MSPEPQSRIALDTYDFDAALEILAKLAERFRDHGPPLKSAELMRVLLAVRSHDPQYVGVELLFTDDRIATARIAVRQKLLDYLSAETDSVIVLKRAR